MTQALYAHMNNKRKKTKEAAVFILECRFLSLESNWCKSPQKAQLRILLHVTNSRNPEEKSHFLYRPKSICTKPAAITTLKK
jgi:hypothetical protein